jgi:peptidoglycan/LPS O-acetylase OafA/YrhL
VYAFCLAVGITEFSINGLFHHLCGIFWDYWFVPAYIGLYILSPIINSFVEKSKPGKLVVYLVCFYIFQLACQCFQPSYFNCGYSMLSFVGLYIIGRYIKVTGVVDEIKNRKELAALVLLVTLLIVLCGIAGCTILKKNGTDLTTYHIPFTFTYNNPLIVIQSILIFLFFLKLDIKSKFINWCAISSFSIYLLHMHTDLKQHFYAITDSWYEYPLYLHYCLIIMTMIVVSVVAIPVDKLRITCFNILYNKISKILTK